MNDNSLEHPEIEWIKRTGYPSWNQPKYLSCEVCGDELTFDEVYEDFCYKCLCENCLLKLHKSEINYEDFAEKG